MMNWLLLFAGIVTVLYTVLISLLFVGWRKVYAFVPKGNEKINELISVVVPCRNEEKQSIPTNGTKASNQHLS